MWCILGIVMHQHWPLMLICALFALGASCSTARPSAGPKLAALIPLNECPVTMPGTPYVARAPHPAEPPALYRATWYGNDNLWTMLPRGGANLDTKSFWWSRNFVLAEENQPLIAVTGRRLDAPGSFSAGNPGTNAIADFGTAMLVGIDVPSEGCWEIRAEYKGAELAYIVRVS